MSAATKAPKLDVSEAIKARAAVLAAAAPPLTETQKARVSAVLARAEKAAG